MASRGRRGGAPAREGEQRREEQAEQQIAHEGKEMRVVADELKVIDLHVPKCFNCISKRNKNIINIFHVVGAPTKGEHKMWIHGSLYHILFHTRCSASFGTNDYPSFLTVDWFSREEYEKFKEDLQGKRIHIDAQSASTSMVVKRGPTMLRSVHGLQSNEHIPVNVNQLGQPLGEGRQLLK
ncbi:hypothetical protein Taro_050808 [Colocasia esculenta]|uniref:Uncharacterized protein n=1 Tax=Colocasia esculenta TaxID=4460 RepID=A0A843XF29_COLES|nr:hypothetical protein [Colocasia esculenta]